MALHYDLGGIENQHAICWDENDYMRPVTESIIFHTMFLGMSELTKDNWTEFYARYELLCRINCDPRLLSSLDVLQHVGLKTNATDESRTKFVRRIVFREMDKWMKEAL